MLGLLSVCIAAPQGTTSSHTIVFVLGGWPQSAWLGKASKSPCLYTYLFQLGNEIVLDSLLQTREELLLVAQRPFLFEALWRKLNWPKMSAKISYLFCSRSRALLRNGRKWVFFFWSVCQVFLCNPLTLLNGGRFSVQEFMCPLGAMPLLLARNYLVADEAGWDCLGAVQFVILAIIGTVVFIQCVALDSLWKVLSWPVLCVEVVVFDLFFVSSLAYRKEERVMSRLLFSDNGVMRLQPNSMKASYFWRATECRY